MFSLRPYQQEAVDAIREGHKEHDSVMIEMPTGTGKTLAFVRYASGFEHGRTMIIAPQITLISQAADKVAKETGIYPAIEQAELTSNESPFLRSDYVVASKQTLTGRRQRYKRFDDIGLVVVDECHLAATKLYAEMLDWFRDRGAKILGVTATPKRHDKRAMGQLFDECVYRYQITDAMDDGYLVPIKVNVMQLEEMDLKNIGSKRGFNGETDFVQQELNSILEDPKTVYEIAHATAETTRGKKTAIYCASVNQACAVANVLKASYGIKADWICADESRCTKQHLRETMESFRNDPEGVSHLANVGMLTTGWDFPGLEALVNARPTRSQSLYTQIMGRITRPAEKNGRPVVDGWVKPVERKSAIARSTKPYGLVVDLVDASIEHKLVTAGDVLGGKWTLEEQKEVFRKALDRAEPVDLDELLAEVRENERKKEEERRRRREEEERRVQEEARKLRVWNARYNSREVDPFSGNRGAGVRAGKSFIPPTKKQMGFLKWKMGREIMRYQISKRVAGRMIGQLKAGMSPDEVKRSNRLREANGAKVSKPQSHQPDRFEEVDFGEVFDALR